MIEPGPPRRRAASPADRRRAPGTRRAAGAALVLVAVALVAAACGSTDAVSSTTPGAQDAGTGTTAARAAPPPGTASAPTEPPVGTDPTGAGIPATSTPGPATGPTATTPTSSADPAPLPLGTVVLDLVDRTRPTVSGGTTRSPTRSLPTAVVYPTGDGGPWPLLVFAHGFRLGPPAYSRLVAALVAEGYVVAAPSFPLADEGRAGAAVDRGDLPNQPADLSFVIDQVLGAASDPASPLAGRVDGARIGAVGHSDGADTVLDLGYTAGRADPRVRAVVALAPDAVVAAGSGVGATTPLLLEHGDADEVVPYDESRSVFAAVPARRYFLTLVGGRHLQPVTETTSWTPILDATIVAFLDRYVAGATTDDGAISAAVGSSDLARLEVAG